MNKVGYIKYNEVDHIVFMLFWAVSYSLSVDINECEALWPCYSTFVKYFWGKKDDGFH
jgi:hypothetical protein